MAVLQNAMEELTHRFSSETDPNPIFCYEALTETGKELLIPISLFTAEAKDLWDKEELFTSKAEVLLQQEKLISKENNIDLSQLILVRKFPLFLLADEDILYLMKFFCKNEQR